MITMDQFRNFEETKLDFQYRERKIYVVYHLIT